MHICGLEKACATDVAACKLLRGSSPTRIVVITTGFLTEAHPDIVRSLQVDRYPALCLGLGS